MIKWVIERCDGTADAHDTAIGFVPKENALDVSGLDVSADNLKRLFLVDKAKWKQEVDSAVAFYKSLTVTDDVPVPQALLDVAAGIQAKLA